MQDQATIQVIAAMLRSKSQIKSMSPVNEGLTNRCLKVTTSDKQTLVWRPNNIISQQLGACRKSEFEALTLASAKGLAPKPYAYHSEGLLVHWCEGKARQAIKIDALAALITQIHQLPALKKNFHPHLHAMHYLQQLIHHPAYLKLLQLQQKFQKKLPRTFFPPTCIHCDLGAYNLIQSGNKPLQVIDWEYARFGDPSFDVTMAALANHLPISDLASLYCYQRKIKDLKAWQKACAAWQPFTDFLAALWFYVGFEFYQTDDYQQQANYHLNKLE